MDGGVFKYTARLVAMKSFDLSECHVEGRNSRKSTRVRARARGSEQPTFLRAVPL